MTNGFEGEQQTLQEDGLWPIVFEWLAWFKIHAEAHEACRVDAEAPGPSGSEDGPEYWKAGGEVYGCEISGFTTLFGPGDSAPRAYVIDVQTASAIARAMNDIIEPGPSGSDDACPHAKSDMTPCYLRDGDVTKVEIYGKPCCVGCEKPFSTLRPGPSGSDDAGCGGRGWVPCPVNPEVGLLRMIHGCPACRNRGGRHDCGGCVDCEDIADTLQRGGYGIAFDTGPLGSDDGPCDNPDCKDGRVLDGVAGEIPCPFCTPDDGDGDVLSREDVGWKCEALRTSVAEDHYAYESVQRLVDELLANDAALRRERDENDRAAIHFGRLYDKEQDKRVAAEAEVARLRSVRLKEKMRADRAEAECERLIRDTGRVVAILVKRLGGQVTITPRELAALDGTHELVRWDEVVTHDLHIDVRAALEEGGEDGS